MNPLRASMLLHFLRSYLNPPDGKGQAEAFDLVAVATKAVTDGWVQALSRPEGERSEDHTALMRALAEVAHSLAQQLYFASGALEARGIAVGEPQPRGDQGMFAAYALPIIRQLAPIQLPQVTHPLVETLVHLANIDPREVLLIMAEAVPAAGPYSVDQLAGGVVIPYLKMMLAEHQGAVLGDAAAIESFRHLLQAFAAAGQGEALALAYTFSDVFR